MVFVVQLWEIAELYSPRALMGAMHNHLTLRAYLDRYLGKVELFSGVSSAKTCLFSAIVPS